MNSPTEWVQHLCQWQSWVKVLNGQNIWGSSCVVKIVIHVNTSPYHTPSSCISVFSLPPLPLTLSTVSQRSQLPVLWDSNSKIENRYILYAAGKQINVSFSDLRSGTNVFRCNPVFPLSAVLSSSERLVPVSMRSCRSQLVRQLPTRRSGPMVTTPG